MKSFSFRTLRRPQKFCEAFNSNSISRCATFLMHQARLMLHLHLQSIGGVNRTIFDMMKTFGLNSKKIFEKPCRHGLTKIHMIEQK